MKSFLILLSVFLLFSCSQQTENSTTENNVSNNNNSKPAEEKIDAEALLSVFESIVKGNDYSLVDKHFITGEHIQSIPGFENMEIGNAINTHVFMVKENIAKFCLELAENGIDTTQFSLGEYKIRLGPNSKHEKKYILNCTVGNMNYEGMGIVLDNHTKRISFGLGFAMRWKK